MPPRSGSRRSGDLSSLADNGHVLDFRRSSGHHQPSRFGRDTPLPPRSCQSLKFNDNGVKPEKQIRPPFADLPLDFVKNADNGYSVRTKFSQNQSRKSLSKEDELIKYIAKLPAYLQNGDNLQRNVLNFGVVTWKHKQSRSIGCHLESVPELDRSPGVRPLTGKVINHPDMATLNSLRSKKESITKENDHKQERKDKAASVRDGIEALGRLGEKPNNQDARSESLKKLNLNSSNRHSSDRHESIVLLIPKVFPSSCSSEVSQKEESIHGKLSRSSKGSFSGLFSVDGIRTDESVSGIRHSCSLNRTVEAENDLDMRLNNLIKAHAVDLPDKPANIEPWSNGSPTKTARITQRLSFRESSVSVPQSSMYVKANSGPAKPEGSAASKVLNSNISNIPPRARVSPLRRLLDPLLKSKVVKKAKDQHSSELTVKPPIAVAKPAIEKQDSQNVKALLYLTVKNGLPLFRFVVEIHNETLASTVKSLSSYGEDDTNFLYTFYSVHKTVKNTSGWKNQKIKPVGFEYNVVGQMRSSAKESVLCRVDVNKSDATSSALMNGRELAAIVIDMLNEGSCDFEAEKRACTVVILPSGDHSLPHDGAPSSLINRWRTGGLCDCGGWDEGCKLRVLSETAEERKVLVHSRYSPLMDFRCSLYDQGESKQGRPLFRLVPFRDGIFSVEFDAVISSLQAFSICVAVINREQQTANKQLVSKQESD